MWLARVRDGAGGVWECRDVRDTLQLGVPLVACAQVEACDEGWRKSLCVLLSALVGRRAMDGDAHARSCPRHWPEVFARFELFADFVRVLSAELMSWDASNASLAALATVSVSALVLQVGIRLDNKTPTSPQNPLEHG